jgi:hypothetical protein
VAWDEARGLFNYYERAQGTWVWAGDSHSALAPGSRGNGCFDSHVNGSVVMKELKQPWLHWLSMKANILLADDDPLRVNPLYTSLSGAEDLELVIKATVSRWTRARLEQTVKDGRVRHVDWLLRQLCTTTTVNLVSTDIESRSVVQDPARSLPLPLTFWFNADVLLDMLDVPADFGLPTVAGRFYLDSLQHYDFALTEGDSFRQPGDTFFAFAVPEPSFEDNDVVAGMLASGLLTPRFVASLLMVDFPNPVFSPARERLLRYVPEQARLDPAGGGLSDALADAIGQAASGLAEESPEAEFLANWRLPESEWRAAFARRLQDYMAAVNRRIATPEGFDAYVRLAESRRREFRRMRLNEFTLTLPTTNIAADAPLLQMNPDGTVSAKTS